MYRVKNTLKGFIESEKSGGLFLIVCTIFSLLLANSSIGNSYIHLWEIKLGAESLGHWVNEGLMAFFFLLVGLELMEEIQEGQLSNLRSALLPISAALGGMLVPAGIYIALNWGTDTVGGFGIPMATDIAFALGVLSLLGRRVPLSLKIFLTALAVIDDLGAIIIIAIFYSSGLDWVNLFISLGIFASLLACNKILKIKNIIPYLVGGVAMWYFMSHSGVHATIAGVLLAITIPYEKKTGNSLCHRIQRKLHYPVAFFVLPVFALANTAMKLEGSWDAAIGEPMALGIILGLIVGKPLGITLFSWISIKLKLCKMPSRTNWRELIGVSILGGVGFTMSIFVALLAFDDRIDIQNEAKLMILLASLMAGVIGFAFLSSILKNKETEE